MLDPHDIYDEFYKEKIGAPKCYWRYKIKLNNTPPRGFSNSHEF